MMLLYMGSYLYQLNGMYERSKCTLKLLLNEALKHKINEYVGVYLISIIKLKANILEWEQSTQYLMKLLAYAWLFNMQDLEVWVYFELSRAYFFMGKS
jgi:hypothetical protein